MKYNKISIIIPVYNEETTINKIVKRVMDADCLGLNKEIIIVDDGSTDNTPNILANIKSKKIIKITNKRNYGKGYSLRRGFKIATGDIILIQDADLEYNPKDYAKIIRPFLNHDSLVVYGSRELSGKNKHSSVFFHAGGRTITTCTNLLYRSHLTDVPTGYKAFQSDLLNSLQLKCTRFEFCPEVTAKILSRGINIIEVPIKYDARHKKDGKKIKWVDGIEALWTLIKIKCNL